MFSVVLPGRPCLTEAVPIQPDPNTPPTNFAFTFPAAPKFSHIVVFLLPGVTLPPDAAAAVYIQFPNQPSTTALGNGQQQQPEFRFLGAIANEKPSAIFKVNIPGSQRPMTEAEQENEMMDEGSANINAANPNSTITLGISIESTQVIREKLATLQQPQVQSSGMELVKRTGPSAVSTKVLAQRIIGNAFNFLASFAASDPRAQGEEVVPLKSFRDWWAKFERRIEADPGFLEREGS
ncbi:hypothetical protein MaudCBS49596_002146 [Microsporum audouinii]